MAELSSPLQVAGLIETDCASDTRIYSIYSFKTEDMGGREYTGFGIFYSPANDLGQKWFREVKLLWEDGDITNEGREFLKAGWKLSEDRSKYINDQGETIRITYMPIGKDGKPI